MRNQAVRALNEASRVGHSDNERMFALRSPLTVRALESDCGRVNPLASVELADGSTSSGLLRWSEQSGLFLEPMDDLVEGACRLHFSLHGVMFVLRAQLTQNALHDARWFTFDRRMATRLPVDSGLATLSWSAPTGAAELSEADVADLTPSGTQIRLAPHSSLPPGQSSFPAELTFGEQRISCVAELRQLWSHDGEQRAGLRLLTDPQDSALSDLYLAKRFPQLRARRTVSAPELVELLRRSGYLALRDGNQASHDWCSLDVPNSSSCDVVYEARDGTLLGHISATRVYSDSWLFHQLATVSDHEETVECRKNLYGLVCTAPNVYSGERAHGLAYFNLDKRWHRLFFEEFTHWIDDAQEARITKLDRFERSHAALPELPCVPGYCAELATRSELIVATAMVREQLPKLLADTMDISPWRLRQNALCGSQRAEHYTRSREVFVVRGPEGVEGVALCERGSAELSLFDILNMAHVFVSSRRRPSEDVQRLLLGRVRAYYADHGVLNPLIVSPHATLEAESEPGTRLVETMGAMSMSSFAMRQWENFCQVHFSHQLGRA
jgi:hypothetical protein